MNSTILEMLSHVERSGKNWFEKLEDYSLFPLNVYMVDHIGEDVSRSGGSNFFYGTSCGHCSYDMKTFIRVMATPRGIRWNNAAEMMSLSAAIDKSWNLQNEAFQRLYIHRSYLNCKLKFFILVAQWYL